MIVMETINGSAHHAHPEKLLLSMLADDNMEVRVKAIDIIIRLTPSVCCMVVGWDRRYG